MSRTSKHIMITNRDTQITALNAVRPTRARNGFSLIELVVVIVIAGVIMGIAMPKLHQSRADRVARNARDVFVWNAQRARAKAIQSGKAYLYELNPSTNRAWIVKKDPTVAADTLLTINFSTQYESTVSTAANTRITVCYNPFGYAFSCSANSPNGPVDVTFTHVRSTARARLKVLGQVDRL